MRTGDEPVNELDPSGLGLFLKDVSTEKAQQFWDMVAAEARKLNQSWGMTGATLRTGGRLDFNPEDQATIAKILQERGHLLHPLFAQALRAAISNDTYRMIDFNQSGDLLVAQMVRRTLLGEASLDADVTPWSFPIMYGYFTKYTGRTIAGSGEYHYVGASILGLFAEVTVEIRLAQLSVPCAGAIWRWWVGAGAAAATGQRVITFGHGAPHLEEYNWGISAESVEYAIRQDVLRQIAARTALQHQNWVQVSGGWIQYRLHELANGVINIGTYFPVSDFGAD
jgi:hypothetical protein